MHPSKMEVRFNDQPGLYAFLEEQVRDALHRREMIPDVKLDGKPERKAEEGLAKKPEAKPERKPEAKAEEKPETKPGGPVGRRSRQKARLRLPCRLWQSGNGGGGDPFACGREDGAGLPEGERRAAGGAEEAGNAAGAACPQKPRGGPAAL